MKTLTRTFTFLALYILAIATSGCVIDCNEEGCYGDVYVGGFSTNDPNFDNRADGNYYLRHNRVGYDYVILRNTKRYDVSTVIDGVDVFIHARSEYFFVPIDPGAKRKGAIFTIWDGYGTTVQKQFFFTENAKTPEIVTI